MKISNLRFITTIACFLLIIIFTVLTAALLIKRTVYDLALVLMAAVLIVGFIKLEFVCFELSGGCISIRKSHPFTFKKFLPPTFELPQDYLRHYDLHNGLGIGVLKLKLKSSKDKKFMVKIRLIGFSKSQKYNVENRLHSVLERNYGSMNLPNVA